MEKDLERYYNDFKRPPFAPTFHPTEEEFADPISYVAKIKPQAQQFGLIKIIPPPSFRPPFCIEPAKFEFVPRVQRLNEIDALFRLRIIYINKLVHFWKYSKDQQFRIPYIDNKYIDLYRLRQMVDQEGGLKRVNDARRWAHIAKCLGFRGNAGQTMRQCYTRWIHPFELSVTNKEQHHEQQQQQRRTASTSPKKGATAAGGGGKIRGRRSKQKVAATTAQPQHTDAATALTDQVQQQLHDEEGSCSSASCSMPSSSSSCSQLSSSSISAGTGTTAKCVDEIGAVQTAATAASVEAVQVQGSAEGTEMALSTAEQQLNTDEQHNNRDTETEEDEGHHHGEADEEDEVPAPPLTRSQARMMAGSAKTAVPSLDKSSIQAGHRTTPIELVMCGRCGAGDDEARLLLCETCDASMHTYCATPPLAVVPKGEWRCAQCVASAVRSVSMDFGFTDSNQCFTLDTFGEWANLYKQQYFNQEPHEVPPDRVEREFWRNVIDIDKGVQVKYGADLISSKVGSGFPRREDPAMRGGVAADARERQQYANHPWNLNNLPKVRESVLCHMTTDISGMIIPWVYIGMLFSTFCWHVEDHWLYSINYNHWGERKIWYGVPGEEAELFDKVVKESAPELFMENKDLLHQMITHINPQFLIDRGLHVYTVHQNAGEFVITFPRSYHAGFNEGLNCAEAVNFAPPDWLKMGRLCLENYANVGRTCVFSHEELVMKMVTVAHKLSIAMCMATLDELSWIVARETDFRHRLSIAGVCATAFCRFEDIPDDERSCAVCRTTLFCSGLCCRHDGRMVCAKHVQQLCTECSMEQYCLKFRYTLDDLVPLVHRLTERTTAFFEWRTTVAELLNCTTKTAPTTEADNNSSNNEDDDDDGTNDDKLAKMDAETNGGERAGNVGHDNDGGGRNSRQRKKIDVLQMRALADQWRTARFPHCEQIQRINQAIVQFERTANAVRKMLNRKIRLRDQTRCQKADTRWEYAEVLSLRQQLADSMLEDRELEDAIQDLCHRVERWKSRTNAALERSLAAAAAQQTVNELYALVTEAREEFNVKLEAEGLDRLKSELARCQWLVNAHTILREIERWHNIAEKAIGTEEEGKEEQKQSVDEQKQHNETEEEKMDAKRGTKTEDNKNVEGIVEEQSSPIDEGMAPEEEEEAEGEGEQKRVELLELAKTVADGLKWCTNCTAVQQLNAKLEHFLNHGNAFDQRAADFLAFARNQQQKQQKTLPISTTAPSSSSGGGCVANTAPTGTVVAVVGVELARQKWAEIAAAMTATAQNNNCGGNDAGNGSPSPSMGGIDWIQSPAIDSFRAELQLAQKAYDDFDQLYKKAFSLRTLEQLEHNFAQSLFERDGQRHAKLKGWLDGLQHFVARTRTIFQKTVSYYTLFDIVAGRSDLPALIEGESMPLALFTSAKYSDNWRPMRAFESRDQLVAHLQSVGDQQCTLLHALRVTNAGRSPKETCSCARDAPPFAASPRRRGAQRLTPQSSTSASGSKATGGSRQRKRASLPSRTAAAAGRAGRGAAAAATSSAFDTSPPTMVISGRTAVATPTTSSLATCCTSTSSSTAEQHQQHMDTDGQQQQQHNNNNNNSLQTEAAAHVVAVEQQQQQRIAPNELIPCFVCNANLHVVCVQWDPFFARLPPGVLLCQRCLRSRRPCIEDVEAACRNSELPENCLERIVVQNLFNRSVNIFTRLQRLLHTIPTGTKQIEQNVETALKKWLTMALSLEITDIEVYNVLANSAYFDLFPLPARQIQIWHHVRERMVDAQPLPIIFGHSISGPSASGGCTNCGGSGGRRVSNAGGKKRSGGNNNGTNNGTNHQHLRHSLSAMLNISSSSVSSVDSSSSLLLFPPLSSSSHSASGSSPAKQQRRHNQQQQSNLGSATASSTTNCANADDGMGDDKMGDYQNGNELAMMDGQQQQMNHVDGKRALKREADEQMEQEEEEGSSNDHQHEHDDDDGAGGAHMEKCAADFCLRPYSEFTRWIQCEAGCARWYHFCCVGISVRGVQQISAYCCYKCAAAAASTAAAATEANTTTAASNDGHGDGTLAKVATVADDSGGKLTVPVVAADNGDDEIKMEQQQPQHSPPPPPAQHRSPTATATVYN